MQNKLLKLLLNWDRRYTPSDLVHHWLSILKIDDVHIAKNLLFVNECRFLVFQKCLSIIIRFGEHELTYGMEAAWISHGLGLIWVLVDVISKVFDYGTTIYRQPVVVKKNSFHKQLSKFLIRKYN